MLAVFAGVDDVRAVLEESALDLVIANKNAPRQCVLSGPAAEIERSKHVFAARQIATHPIGVSRAFHSRLVAGAVELVPARCWSRSTSLPRRYRCSPTQRRSLIPPIHARLRAVLAGQLARPVEFVAQIEAMYAMGARTFLEVGPDAKLTPLVRAILEGQDHQALAVDASRGAAGNVHDLACTLASLAALGYAVDLTRWDEGEPRSRQAARSDGESLRCQSSARATCDRTCPRPRQSHAGTE